MLKAFIGVRRAVFFAAAAAFAGASSAAAQQIEVGGDNAQYSADGSRAEFTGNVVLQSGGATVYADRLIVDISPDGNRYHASGPSVRAECADCAAESLVLRAAEIILQDGGDDTLTIGGGLTLCAGESCGRGQLVAERAEWKKSAGEARLRGMPVSGFWFLEGDAEPVRMRANEVEYAHGAGDVRLRGNASLSRGEDDIRGELIEFNIKTGAINATGGSDSRVRGVFGADE